jgi:hypothetical protein
MIVITEVATACGIFAVLALPAIAAFLLLPLLGIVLQGTSSVLYATIGEFVEPERLPRTFGFSTRSDRSAESLRRWATGCSATGSASAQRSRRWVF